MCCGSGSHSLPLAEMGFQVTGVDLSPVLIQKAKVKARLKKQKIKFISGDVLQMQKRESFEGVTLLGSTLSIAQVYARFPEFLSAAQAALVPGGFFIFDLVIGDNFKKLPDKPLRYGLENGVAGELSIQGKRAKQGIYELEYHWKIQKPGTIKPILMIAREELVFVRAEKFCQTLDGSHQGFKVQSLLRDYDARKVYRKGDPNLVVVMKKCLQ